jgi:2-polyprenyl-6-methoxyphenol hydroxylase-like FAD-dependent oxidoreductase
MEYIFGKTVDRFTQDDKEVTAYFSDGSSSTFDLLAGADGQGSQIRRAILPPTAADPNHPLGVHIACWFMPRVEGNINMCKVYLRSGRRMIMRRSHCNSETQVYFFLQSDEDELRSNPRATVAQQEGF